MGEGRRFSQEGWERLVRHADPVTAIYDALSRRLEGWVEGDGTVRIPFFEEMEPEVSRGD